MNEANAVDTAFIVLEVVGTIAFALSGVMAAARARMDWGGAVVLAVVVSIGGGTIRDVLLGNLPVAWLIHIWPVEVALVTAGVAVVVLRLWPNATLDDSRPILVADAAGLGAFVVLGTQIGLDAGLAAFLAVMLGVLTGVGGGVIRDVLTGTKPAVLVSAMYAVAGLMGAAWYTFLWHVGLGGIVGVWSAVAIVFIVRMVAIWRSWSLPMVVSVTVLEIEEKEK